MQKDMRRKVIGGISEEDVNLLIQNIQEYFEELESEYNKKITELTTAKTNLVLEFDQYMQHSKKEKAALEASMEELQRDLNKFLEESKEKDQIIADLEAKLADGFQVTQEPQETQDNDELQAKVESLEIALHESREAEERLKSETSRLEDKLQRLESAQKSDNDFQTVIMQLDKLKDQVVIINDLKMQVEDERDRAVKAEEILEVERSRTEVAKSELEQLRAILQDVKGKYHREQTLLELKFSDICEKYRLMEADLSSFYSNLSSFKKQSETEMAELFDDGEKYLRKIK